ncbi:hypothetical protein GCM10023147_45650 [Tsukamurella soli]|uniref:Uncharacterized protein n=2 Tax=Tsukamurella soli TaxID=644556 RepID=A0ABP8KCB2_9ACTN
MPDDLRHIVAAVPEPDGFATRVTIAPDLQIRRAGPQHVGGLLARLAQLPLGTPVRIGLFDFHPVRIERIDVQRVGGEFTVVLMPCEPEVI